MTQTPDERPMDADADLALLRDMADAVAKRVKAAAPERFGEELGIGADGTATKWVDDVAEQEILHLLRERKPGWNLLSEEAGFLDLGGDRVLVADPIDGTTNAVRGIPFYCVSLAIGRKTLADIDVGLVVNLATGDRYEAVRGQGATLNGRAIRALHAVPASGAVVSTGLYRGSGASKGNLKGIGRSFGASALEMCLVAQGALDAYHYPKPILRVIDVAASALIVRESGGVVLDRSGADLELPLSLVPRFGLTAAGTRDLAEEVGVTFE